MANENERVWIEPRMLEILKIHLLGSRQRLMESGAIDVDFNPRLRLNTRRAADALHVDRQSDWPVFEERNGKWVK